MFVALQLLFHVVFVAVINVVTCLSLLQLLLQLLPSWAHNGECICRKHTHNDTHAHATQREREERGTEENTQRERN
jgi:hypothetical protein